MQAGLRLCCGQTTEDRFSRGEARLSVDKHQIEIILNEDLQKLRERAKMAYYFKSTKTSGNVTL